MKSRSSSVSNIRTCSLNTQPISYPIFSSQVLSNVPHNSFIRQLSSGSVRPMTAEENLQHERILKEAYKLEERGRRVWKLNSEKEEIAFNPISHSLQYTYKPMRKVISKGRTRSKNNQIYQNSEFERNMNRHIAVQSWDNHSYDSKYQSNPWFNFDDKFSDNSSVVPIQIKAKKITHYDLSHKITASPAPRRNQLNQKPMVRGMGYRKSYIFD